MDFHNICSQIDVDAIRAKLPPLPEMFTQFKLPKSIAKLKSRKIFGSSRENIHGDEQRSDSKRSAKRDVPSETSSAGFIDHTPNKISTISSLVDQRRAGGGRRVGSTSRGDEGFYRNAGGIDDYCPSPENFSKSRSSITHMSPRGGPSATTEEGGKLSLVERVQKSYKDASEFRLKHMFVKKTVVRQDGIKLDDYVERYAEDRRLEERYEEKMEQGIADNYNFNFKTSRRKSEESFGISTPSDSPSNIMVRNKKKKPLSEQSGDESGMEQSPPPRKPGIASTRFSRVRKEPLNMSLEEDDGIVKLSLDDSDDEEIPLRPPPMPETKTKSVTRQKSEETNAQSASRQKSREQEMVRRQQSAESTAQKTARRQRSLEQEIEDDDEMDDMEEIEEIEEIDVAEVAKPKPPKSKTTKKPSSPKKRQAPVMPQRSTDNSELDMSSPARRNSSSSEAQRGKTLGSIKGNFKRFQKSMKLGASSTATQSGTESEADEGGKKTKSQQFTERLKRFRSVDNVDKQTEVDEPDKSYDSPMHRLNNKLQDWKKSFKKKADSQRPEAAEDVDEATSPKKLGKAQASLMRKLKQIRSRKRPTGDDPDEDEEGGATYREDFRARAKLQLEKGVAAASQMPQITLEKIKETKKYFRKTQEKTTEPKQESMKEVRPKAINHDSEESNLDDDEEEEQEEKVKNRAAPAVKSATKPPVKQHYYTSDEDEQEDDEEDEYDRRQQQLAQEQSLEPYQQKVLVPMARAAWTTKPIHSDSMDTGDDDDDILPRVLIHQDNSDVFESTLIIAVTRPMPRSHSPSAFITELPPDSPKASTPATKADQWVPHQEMISTFLANSEPLKRELSRDTIASISSKGHSRKHSMDSSSEDSWIKDVPRGPSIAVGLNSVTETEESWKVQAGKKDETLYKTKSIDIFEKSGGMKIFDDFDDELKNTPIVKIERQVETKVVEIREISNNASFERDSSEELDNADDDNSSRVTKILKQPEKVQKQEHPPPRPPPIKPRDDKVNAQGRYGNSAESLMENAEAVNISQAEEDKAESDEEDNYNGSDDEDNVNDGSDEEYNRPPSATPSPPPAVTPPPPPLPARQPSIRLSKLPKLPSTPPEELPPSPRRPVPPLPKTKPPVAPNRPAPQPPKIPERTPSMSRVARPLVKTSSLRLSFDEQVNPEDVGKVNKLISRFEPNGGFSERPRLIPKRPYMSLSPEDYSEDEEEISSEAESKNMVEFSASVKTILTRERSLDITPTNKPKIEKSFSIDSVALPVTPTNVINNNNNVLPTKEQMLTEERNLAKTKKPAAPTIIDAPPSPSPEEEVVTPKIPSISISSTTPQTDANSNFSQPNSEYGSPMAYPSSLVGSAQATPQSIRKETDLLQTRRSRRSMTRDPERFYSFDSDEEDSYYSIGSANNNRYVVDL